MTNSRTVPSSIWVRGLEFLFGPILFTVEAVFAWFLLALGLGGGGVSRSYPPFSPDAILESILTILWFAAPVLIVAMLVSFSRLIIGGPERVCRRPFSRWFAIATIFLILATYSLCFLLVLTTAVVTALEAEIHILEHSLTALVSVLVFGLFAAPPVWIGLRYLPSLLRRTE